MSDAPVNYLVRLALLLLLWAAVAGLVLWALSALTGTP